MKSGRSAQTNASPAPYYLGPHHFMMEKLDEESNTGFNASKCQIIDTLNALTEWDFEELEDPNNYITYFKGLYIHEDIFSSLMIHIYEDLNEKRYVCSVTHTEGDPFIFNNFFDEFKFRIDSQEEPKHRKPFKSPPVTKLLMSAETFVESMQPIFNMAQDNYEENQLEAAKMLICQAKENSLLLLDDEVIAGVITSLKNLIKNDQSTLVQSFAVIACLEFLRISGYEKPIMSSGLPDKICQLIKDHIEGGKLTLQSAKMVRVCAKIIEHLQSDNVIELFPSKALVQKAKERSKINIATQQEQSIFNPTFFFASQMRNNPEMEINNQKMGLDLEAARG